MVDCDTVGDVEWDMEDNVEKVGVPCDMVGDNGADVVDKGEPGQSDGGGIQVLGISAIGTNHVAVKITPYPIAKHMS